MTSAMNPASAISRNRINALLGSDRRERQSLNHSRLQAVEPQYAPPTASQQKAAVHAATGRATEYGVGEIRMDPARAKFELMLNPTVPEGLKTIDSPERCRALPLADQPTFSKEKAIATLRKGAVVALLLIGCFLSFDYYHQQSIVSQGAFCASSGQAEKAIGLLNSALAHSPSNSRAYFHRGTAYASAGNYPQALADFNRALDLGSPKSVTLTARASVYLRTHDFDKAIDDCTSALFYDTKNIEALELRAVCYAHKESFANVIADCNQALSLTKDRAQRARLQRERATALIRENDAAEAIGDVNAALAQKVTEPLLLQRATIYSKQHKTKAAIADCTAALKLNPWSAHGLVLRGKCLAQTKHRSEAIRDFTAAQLIDPNSVEALIQRANVYLSAGDKTSAAADLRRALQLNPYITEVALKLKNL